MSDDLDLAPVPTSTLAKMQPSAPLIQTLAAHGLSRGEMAAYFQVHRSTFHTWCKTNPEYLQAIETGRAKGLLICAQTVVKAAKTDPRIALDYLKAMGDRWRPGGPLAPFEAGEGIEGSTNKLPEIPEHLGVRMAKTYLEQRGWTCIAPMGVQEETINLEPVEQDALE